MATAGYPGSYPKHTPINGVDDAAKQPNVPSLFLSLSLALASSLALLARSVAARLLPRLPFLLLLPLLSPAAALLRPPRSQQ
eukprot:1739288-Rhodomonas_salina.1